MNNSLLKIAKNTLLILFFAHSYTVVSQDLTDNLKIWSGVTISYKVNPNLNAKLGQLFAFNVSPGTYSFSQTKLALSYKVGEKTSVEGGYVRGLFNDSNFLRRQGASSGWFNTLVVSRVYGNFSFKHKIVKRVSLRHKFEYQYFFTDLDKYKTRGLYSVRLSYNIRRSSISPYIENQFYYYQGGIISNGIKRNRFRYGLRFKPFNSSSVRISIYHIFQNEFNTDTLSDNDYSVFGINLSYKIN